MGYYYLPDASSSMSWLNVRKIDLDFCRCSSGAGKARRGNHVRNAAAQLLRQRRRRTLAWHHFRQEIVLEHILLLYKSHSFTFANHSVGKQFEKVSLLFSYVFPSNKGIQSVWKWLKMSHFNVLILAFFTYFCLVTLFERKPQGFKNSPNWTIFGIFNLLSTQNVIVARFARNVKLFFFPAKIVALP